MRWHHIALLSMLMLLLPGIGSAQLSPGPLSAPHEHLSGMTNCLNCHIWGEKDPSPKCQDCHSLIQGRIESASGFHGQLEEKSCIKCHSDHLGQEFEMIRWELSQAEFDHSLTGYDLDGKHKDLKCEQCHSETLIKQQAVIVYSRSKDVKQDYLSKTFLGLRNACADCHSDVHHGEFKAQLCEDCHTTWDWANVRNDFDHEIQTSYPLKGAHEKLACEKCHDQLQIAVKDTQVHKFAGLRFEKCTDCHADEHKGAFGQNCLECHSVRTFKLNSAGSVFDHEKSRFPLVGQHKLSKCVDCHTSKGQYTQTASFDDCVDCHADQHKGAFLDDFGNNYCDECHSESGFLPALFGMAKHKETSFPLTGAHLAIPCFACHGPSDAKIYSWDPLACESCHKSNHGPQFQRYNVDDTWCENCHGTSDWADHTFDHEQTQFKLKGQHAVISCEKCHETEDDIVLYEGLDLDCLSCHEDVHYEQFEDASCETCHGFNEWKIAKFDHQSSTQFPLDGQHKLLQCGQCHKFESALNTIRFKPIKHDCQDCHQFGDFR